MWMQYVDKGSVVPPPFNLLPSGKYFIEFCKRCYDRIKSQKVRNMLTLFISLWFTQFGRSRIWLSPQVLPVDSVIRSYVMLCIFEVKVEVRQSKIS